MAVCGKRFIEKRIRARKTETFTLIENMDGTMHECMMYMPMYSEVISCKIGIDDDAVIEPLKSDFRHRIAVWLFVYAGSEHGSIRYELSHAIYA